MKDLDRHSTLPNATGPLQRQKYTDYDVFISLLHGPYCKEDGISDGWTDIVVWQLVVGGLIKLKTCACFCP
jgi:hypothetical protein